MYFDYTIDQWNEAAAKELPGSTPLEYLKKHGVYSPPGGPNYGSTLKADHRFITQSGKIEIYSERLKEHGYDPLPVYQPPAEPPPGKFRLVLGRKAFYTHANSTNNPWLFDFAPENRLWINPAGAKTAGVSDGDRVEVKSNVGTAELRVKISQEIRPDCVFMMHGFGKRSPWLKRTYNRGGCDAALLETAWDKVSGNAAMHETFVKLRKV